MPRWLMLGVFFALGALVLGSTHTYLYRRLKRLIPLVTRRQRLAAAVPLAFMACSYPLSRLWLHAHYDAVSCCFFWLACLWLGAFFYLFLFALLSHLLAFLVRRFGLERPLEKVLRLSAERCLAILAVAGAACLTVYGICEARCKVEVTRVAIPVEGLPPELEALRIVQVTDVHVGAIIAADRLTGIVERVNALEPDLVVFTGDLVDQDAERFNAVKQPLSGLSSRLGVFGVTGNHEYFSDVDKAVAHATQAGIRFLRNEKVTLEGGLLLYGIDDPTGRRLGFEVPDFDAVIGPEARRAPAVLLYHQPKGFEEAAGLGIDLMLSGHTHRGQIWPISYLSSIFYPRQYGLYRCGRSHLFVSRGIGTWGPPMRVGSPPEIALITLHRLRAGAGSGMAFAP
ncbi:MAG: metallophosphoesterase [Deltaproteobacteria bacterium]|nr:metallophosphoesterase [Deltaproteobacteria bacterium]